MKDIELNALIEEWFTQKAHNPEIKMKDFILKKHLEYHADEPAGRQEEVARLEQFQRSWAARTHEYEAALEHIRMTRHWSNGRRQKC